MIVEIRGNLFDVPKDYVLAHCVSACGTMGQGIAAEFAKRNPGLREYVWRSRAKIGDALYFKEKDNHAIYNLVTKQFKDQKPTREDFNKTLINFRDELLKQGIKKVAIPKIGAGLDKLSWEKSLILIKELFLMEDIEVLIVYENEAKTSR